MRWLLALWLLLIPAAALAGHNEPHQILFGNIAVNATLTGTTEQTLATFSLPANALNVVGRRLHVRAMFSTAANTNTKTARLYFGANVVSLAQAASAVPFFVDLWITKSGANTQIVTGLNYAPNTNAATIAAAGTNTDTAAIVIKATCQDTTSAAGDCTLQDFLVEWVN